MKYSMNDLFILEPYKHGQGLRSHVQNGFATVEQKTNLVGLRLLFDAKLKDGSIVRSGSVAYIAEDLLNNSPWAKSVRKSPGLTEEQFIVVESRYITLVDLKESES